MPRTSGSAAAMSVRLVDVEAGGGGGHMQVFVKTTTGRRL
eukprot:COSAG01_NODE_42789_length_436_cov_1.676558_1_plen_39_part_10